MRRVLFDALAFLGEASIDLLHNVGDLLSLGIESFFNLLVWLAANTFKAILWVVDSDRLNHA